jgi:hypothetical protein
MNLTPPNDATAPAAPEAAPAAPERRVWTAPALRSLELAGTENKGFFSVEGLDNGVPS